MLAVKLRQGQLIMVLLLLPVLEASSKKKGGIENEKISNCEEKMS